MRRSGLYYRTSQGLAIFLGGMTPVLVVLLAVFDDYQNLLLVLIALFPALAMRRSRHWRLRTLNSISAILSQLAWTGV